MTAARSRFTTVIVERPDAAPHTFLVAGFLLLVPDDPTATYEAHGLMPGSIVQAWHPGVGDASWSHTLRTAADLVEAGQ